MNQDERLIDLIEKYLKGTCTASEKMEVEEWYEQISNNNQNYYNNDEAMIRNAAEASLQQIKNRINIDKDMPLEERKIISFRSWYAAAAVVIVMLVSGLYFFKQYTGNFPDKAGKDLVGLKNKIVPGSNQAILTLANGSKIILNETKAGDVAEQAGVKITKTADGQLIYTVENTNETSGSSSSLYNTITTPKGGQYQVILPDGTHVWLNAASSLRYPTIFDAKQRDVYLAGEGYFEVAKKMLSNGNRMPFIVQTFSQQVEVLGTHFNINAYKDEDATITTLFEGSVKVLAGKDSKLIKPGEYSFVKGDFLKTGVADLDASIAWKNGFFSFKKSDIKTVMRQLARWYNIDVEYEGKVPSREFSGEIYRNANIEQVFDLLDYYKVHYRVEASISEGSNKIVIIP